MVKIMALQYYLKEFFLFFFGGVGVGARTVKICLIFFILVYFVVVHLGAVSLF